MAAFDDRSIFIFRPDALDIRLTIAIRQDRGSLLAVVLTRPEYLSAGSFFAVSHSVSAEDQARVEAGPDRVLWPNAAGSLDFYNEPEDADEPAGEPATGSQGTTALGEPMPPAFTGGECGGYVPVDEDGANASSAGSEEVDPSAVVGIAGAGDDLADADRGTILLLDQLSLTLDPWRRRIPSRTLVFKTLLELGEPPFPCCKFRQLFQGLLYAHL